MDDFKKYLQAHQDELDDDTPRDAVWQRIQAQTAVPKRKINIVKMVMRYSVAACMIAAVAFGIKWLVHDQTSGLAKNPPTLPVLKDTETVAKTTIEKADNSNALPIKDATEQNEKEDVAVVPTKAIPIKKVVSAVKNKPPVATNKQIDVAHLHVNAMDPVAKDLESSYVQLVNLQLGRLRATPVFAEGPDYFLAFKTQIKQMDEDEAAIRKDIKANGMQDALLEKLINIYQQKLNVLKNLQTEINKMNNRVKQNQLPSDSTRSYFLNI